MEANQEEPRSSSLLGCWDRYKGKKKKSRENKRISGSRMRKKCVLLFSVCVLTLLFDVGQFLCIGNMQEFAGNFGWSGITAQAAEMEYIRVGLKSNYENVDQIRIQNTALRFGYCMDSVFYPQETLYSENGFVIQAESGSYSVYSGTYGSYSAAVKDVALLKTLYGVSVAFPVSVGKGNWNIYIASGLSNKVYDKLNGMTRSSEHMLRVNTKNGSFLIDAERAGIYPQFAPQSETIIQLSGGSAYRGRMEVGRYSGNGVTAVNVLPLEEYLYGVVASEMSYSWPMEALKAQAVCARGYALLTAGPGSTGTLTRGYKIGDTNLHQVYKGYTAEHASTNQAVDATRGETVCYDNKVVKTYYFSTSGGSTESVEDVWGNNVSYLRSVSDIFEDNPAKKPWIVPMTKAQILSRIQRKSDSIGSIVSVKPEIKTQSGRIYALKIEGTKGSITLEKDQIRTLLGLYSTKFKVISYGEIPDRVTMQSASGQAEHRISESYVISENGKVKHIDTSMEQYMVLSADNRTGFAPNGPENSDTFLFAGTGFGHGVGMSQSGARGMAEAGYSYKQILEHYYTGTTVN